MTIVAVGFNTPAENKEWSDEEGFTFELWTDDDKTLAITYGAASSTSALTPHRKTAILDADGVLVDYYDSVNVATHASDVLEDCQVLFGE